MTEEGHHDAVGIAYAAWRAAVADAEYRDVVYLAAQAKANEAAVAHADAYAAYRLALSNGDAAVVDSATVAVADASAAADAAHETFRVATNEVWAALADYDASAGAISDARIVLIATIESAA